MAVRPSITIFMNLFIKQLARKPTILCTHPHVDLHKTPANIASHIFRHKRTKPLKSPAFRWPSRATDTRRDALNLDRMLPRATREGSDVFIIDLIQELHCEAMRHDPEYRGVPGEFKSQVNWIGGTDIYRRRPTTQHLPTRSAPALSKP